MGAPVVLMTAYACLPHAGSDPGWGYMSVRAAAMRHQVILLTQPHQVEPVASALEAEGLLDQVEIIPVRGPGLLSRHEGHLGLGHVHYAAWQAAASRAVALLAHRVDVVHHVTYCCDWMPSVALLHRRLPAVWGPVGGRAPVAWPVLRLMAPGTALASVRRLLATASLRWVSGRLARRHPALLLVASHRETADFYRRLGVPVQVEPAVAMPPAPTSLAAQSQEGATRQAVFVARLIPGKGGELAIRTLARLPREWRLDIYGEGPERERLLRLAARLGVTERVRLLGFRPQAEVWHALERADVFLFPSLRDTSGQAFAEATRLGCPGICLDGAGPAAMVDPAYDVAVPLRGDVVGSLAQAVLGARRRPAPDDRWNGDRLAETYARFYSRVLESTST